MKLKKIRVYLHWGLERGRVRVVSQASAVTLFFDAQQDLNVLAILIAAGLFITLHPRLDLALPQRWVLHRLHLRSSTLEKTLFSLVRAQMLKIKKMQTCDAFSRLPLLLRTFWILL